MKNDPRNYLFESYVRILEHFRPKFFIFENVLGLLTAHVDGMHIVHKIFAELGNMYKVKYDPQMLVFNTANYGVPQMRKRVIIIGVRKDLDIDVEDVYASITKTHFDPEMPKEERKRLRRYVTVADAIDELPPVAPGRGERKQEFQYSLKNPFLRKIGSPKNKYLLDHVARQHNEADRERYRMMSRNHWTFEELLANREDLRHENARLFGNSYVVQWWDLPSKTIIAHLYKDGNQFIHPDAEQARTLTVREAARLQSFPDDFVFEGSRTEQYKQIGNAVPPLFAEALAKAMKKNLKEVEKKHDIQSSK